MKQLTFLGPLESDNWGTDHCLRSSSLILPSLWQPFHRGCDPTVAGAVINGNLTLLKNCAREVINWTDHSFTHTSVSPILHTILEMNINQIAKVHKIATQFMTADTEQRNDAKKQAALEHLGIINTMLPVTLFPLRSHVIANSGLHNTDCVPELINQITCNFA